MDLGTQEFTDLHEIGRGGFGVVYTARQSSFDRTVAIKVITLADESTLRRFDRERQALGKVSNHPHITPVFASGFTVDGLPYLAMELMQGGSLEARLKRDGAMPWHEVLDLGVKLSGALETAHRAGILHRDLKPANVLLSDFGQPRLADFGIASLDEGEQTKTGAFTASIAYAAPEVLDGTRPGVPADVYGLGATLFTLLFGSAPFSPAAGEESILAMILRIAHDPVPDLRSAGVPDAFALVLEQALAKSPNDRYETAADLGLALADAQEQVGAPRTVMVLPFDAGGGKPSLSTLSIEPPFAVASPTGTAERPRPNIPTTPAPTTPPSATPTPAAAPSAGRGRVLLVAAGALVLVVVAGLGIRTLTGDADGGVDPTTPGDVAQDTTESAAPADPGSSDAGASDAAASDGPVQAGEWQSVRPIPVARQQIPAVTLSGTVWVAGGLTEDGVTASVQGYEPATNSWRDAPDLPLALHHHMSVVYDGQLVVLGGWSPDGALVSAISSDRVMALQGTEWVDLPPLLQPRVAGAAVTIGDQIIVTGGQDTGGNLVETTEVFDGTAWREVAPMPTAREHLAAVTDGQSMFVVGGRVLSSSANLATVERYDPFTETWEPLPDMPTARGGLAVVWIDGVLVAIGGERPLGVFDEVEAYSVLDQEWTSWPAMPTGRHGLGASIASSTLFTVGGALEATHSAPTDQTEAVGLG